MHIKYVRSGMRWLVCLSQDVVYQDEDLKCDDDNAGTGTLIRREMRF